MSDWYLMRHQRQEEEEQGVVLEEALKNRLPSSHVHNQESPTNCTTLVPMSINEVKELTWEDVVTSSMQQTTTSRPTTWYKDSSDTLESIVHQATATYNNKEKEGPQSRSSSGKWGRCMAVAEDEAEGEAGHMHDQVAPKRMMSEDSDHCGRYYFSTTNFSNNNNNNPKEEVEVEVEGSATFCKDHDATMMSWPSSESLRSVKTKASTGDDLSNSYHGATEENRNDENETKGETVRSQPTRSSRAAAGHNQAERRRRSRINQKMKALQKLVPNASKTDKASMLDEIIEYLKQLQAQVKMMNARNMSQMMVPLGTTTMHQQLQQMSLMARMGMNTGLGMAMGTVFDMNNIARRAQHQSLQSLINSATMAAGAAPTFLPPPFAMPPAIPACNTSRSSIGAATNNSVPCNDPYAAFLAHTMNIEMYNKMAALFRHQAYQSQQTSGSSSQSNLVQGDR